MYARVIRPDLLESNRFIDLHNDTQRFLFVCLILRADDFGNLDGEPRALRRWASAFSELKDEPGFLAAIAALCDADLLRGYQVGSRQYLHIPRFRNERKYFKRHCPPSPWCDAGAPTGRYRAGIQGEDRTMYRAQLADSVKVDSDRSQITQSSKPIDDIEPNQQDRPIAESTAGEGGVNGESLFTLGEGWRGVKDKTLVENEKSTRLPREWVLPDDWADWAVADGIGRSVPIHLTRGQVQRISETFRDYWHGVAGAKGRKLDWLATWRNWVRNTDLTKYADKASPNGLAAQVNRGV